MIAAVAGGAASKWGGGKFANGAVSATFAHLFNNEASMWGRVKSGLKGALSTAMEKLHGYFIRPGGTDAFGIGIDFVVGSTGFTGGVGYFRQDLDGNPWTIENRGFYYYVSDEVVGLDWGMQVERFFSPNPNTFFGESIEIGGTSSGVDLSMSNPMPDNFWTSPADHVYAIGVGPGWGGHWAEVNTQPLIEW
jgi:hypothetical protein